MPEDTIVALATATGEAALSVIRLSGPLSAKIAQEALKKPAPLPHRVTCYGNYYNTKSALVDDVVATYYEEGQSYTGQASLEISCHGNPLIVRKLLDDCITRGCRMAEPGEFTRLAFSSGKMDLTQAEAVAELIRARSDRALAAARNRLQGQLGKRIDAFTTALLRLQAHIEAYIDFPEEDMPDESNEGPIKELQQLIKEVDALASTGRFGEVLSEGVKTVIAGAPNAGKSSLLNALLGEDRAIVSPTPGTTRDFIEDRLSLGPYSIRLLDTAGIRKTDDDIEQQGVNKSLNLLEQADCVLLVLDSSRTLDELQEELKLFHVEQKPLLIIENKIDLPESNLLEPLYKDHVHVRVSLIESNGLDALRTKWIDLLDTHYESAESDSLVVSARHAEALHRASGALKLAKEKLAEDEPTELAATDIRDAVDALGGIVGKIDNERMLDELFGSFCIGK